MPRRAIEVRVYKQESLFDVSDYVQVCAYHHQAGLHHLGMASGYRDRAERRFGNRSLSLSRTAQLIPRKHYIGVTQQK